MLLFYVGKYISLEALIAKDKSAYYEALQKSGLNWHEENEDILPFMKYLLGIILACVLLGVLITRLSSTTKNNNRGKSSACNKSGKQVVCHDAPRKQAQQDTVKINQDYLG